MQTVTEKCDVLYIEDDRVDAESVEREFKKINAFLRIAIAKDGTQALDMLNGRNGEKKITPQVILLDLNMPQMNGIQCLKEVRANPELAGIDVFVLTGAFATKEKMAMHELNVTEYIVKPFEYADALEIFWTVLHAD